MAGETDTSAAGSETTDTGTPLQAQAPSLLDEAGTETGGDDQTDKTKAQAEGEGGETDAKADAKDGTKAEGEKDDKGEAEGAPEEYADFTVPEGSTLDPELLAEFKETFKAENLTQEQAQARVDQGMKLAEKWSERAVEMHLKTIEGWRDQTKADPDIGGDKLPQVLAGAKEVRDHFGDEGLTEVLNTFGLGNHPSVIRFFSKVRAAISDDVFVKSGKPTGEPTRAADVLFGATMNKKEG